MGIGRFREKSVGIKFGSWKIDEQVVVYLIDLRKINIRFYRKYLQKFWELEVAVVFGSGSEGKRILNEENWMKVVFEIDYQSFLKWYSQVFVYF